MVSIGSMEGDSGSGGPYMDPIEAEESRLWDPYMASTWDLWGLKKAEYL